MRGEAICDFIYKRMHECVDEHGKAVVRHMDNRCLENREAIYDARGKCDAYLEMAQFVLDERMRQLA